MIPAGAALGKAGLSAAATPPKYHNIPFEDRIRFG
jgi:hypothetical protein